MNKRANKELFLAKIVIAIALVAIFVAGLWMFIGQDTIAVQSAKEAYSLYMIENPEATDKDFIYIYEDTVIVAIRNGKVVRKEYATEADAVKAALGSKDGANYSLAGTGNGKLFVVKLFEKTDDIYALGTSTLATGAEKLTIKVVSNGMIFATFDIPAEAIDRKQSPVGVTIKKINAEDYITLREDQGGFGYDIDVTNLVENNTARIAITINGPKGLVADANKSPITAYHKDKVISSTYDAKTGQISFSTTSFSPFPLVVNNAKTVDNIADLRYWLQHDGAVNIILGADIEINLDGTDKYGKPVRHDGTVATEDDKGEAVTYTTKDPDNKDATVLLSRGFYENDWIYFGALVRGEKYLDLNGNTITYKGGTNAQDNALFCVVGKSYFAIGDGVDGPSETNGAIEVMFDHYAVWSMDNTSVVDIYDGYFVSDSYVGATPEPNRALLYSSGGEIHVRGGWFVYENTNGGKTNGGFNVLNEVVGTRIWIHSGAFMSEQLYRQTGATDDNKLDDDSIELVGGTGLVTADNVSIYDVEQWYQVNSVTVPVKLPHKDTFIYRVGNLNDVPLEKLFDKTDFSGLSARVVDVLGTKQHNSTIDKNYASGSNYYKQLGNVLLEAYDGNKSLNFSDVKDGKAFSGLVRVELVDSDGAIHSQIYLEVVDGTNVTDYSQLKSSGNFVLLNDITLTADKYSLSNGTLYGNGYTFDVTAGGISGSNAITNNYLVYLGNAYLDNIQIVGPVYEKFGVTTATADYNRPVVLTTGTSGIYNSYISNAFAPVRLHGGKLTIVNSTLKGGAFANLDMRGGELILDDVTTINQANSNDASTNKKVIVGLGIVVWNDVSGGETIRLVDIDQDGDSTLNQYNYVANNHSGYFASTDSSLIKVESIINAVFGINDKFIKINDGVKWVNTGILSLYNGVGENAISQPVGYDWENVSYSGISGHLCTRIADSTNSEYEYFPADPSGESPKPYEPSAQYHIAPKTDWDHSINNNPATGDTDSKSCGYDTSKATTMISFKDGDTFFFNPNILVANKLGNALVMKSIKMDGSDVSGGISFSVAGDYVITYTYTDPYNYRMGENGVESYSIDHTKTMKINVAVTNDADAPIFTFVGTTGNAATITVSDGTVYLSGGVGSAGSKNKEINGQKITYPKVYVKYAGLTGGLQDTDSTTSLDKSSYHTCYCPVFKDVVTINDNGEIYDASDLSMPEDLTYSDLNSGLEWGHGSGTPADNPVTAKYNNTNYLFFKSYTRQGGNDITQKEYDFEFSYRGKDGKLYRYYVCYVFPEKKTQESGGGCVTPDTLITLADGSQVRVDSLTGKEQLLVWNLKTGKYETAPIVFVDSEPAEECTVVHLYFSDGSDVKVLYEHGFFDLDLGKYVYIDANNYADYVGHRFVTEGDISKDTWSVVTLDKINIETEVTTAWSPVTFEHLCYYTNGVLSMPGGIEGLFNIFEVDTETMTYDAEKMANDIATYGLLTLEDFGGMIPQAAFDAFNGQYLNVAIGKGLLTWEQIAALAERYVPLM